MGRALRFKEKTTTITKRVPISKKDEILKKIDNVLDPYKINYNNAKSFYDNYKYLIDCNFFERLKSFVDNVQVNDMTGEEEKNMIINVCEYLKK